MWIESFSTFAERRNHWLHYPGRRSQQSPFRCDLEIHVCYIKIMYNDIYIMALMVMAPATALGWRLNHFGELEFDC